MLHQGGMRPYLPLEQITEALGGHEALPEGPGRRGIRDTYDSN